MCYSKVGEEAKTELRNIYINLTQDEAPMVRKAAATNLVEFLEVLEPAYIKMELIPVLDNIAKDLQDSVKPLAVDVGIAIANRLPTDVEVKDGIFIIMEEFSRDESWKIRHKIATSIHDIQNILGADKNRGRILNMFQTLSKDSESEVRVAAMKNLYNYCKALKVSYETSKGDNNFEHVVIQSIVPLIKFILDDPVEDVLYAASSEIMSLSTLVSSNCFEQHIFPMVVIEALQKHQFIRVKENILKQFEVLPAEINLSRHLDSIKKAMHNLVVDSQLHWRTRRSIILAFVHITKYIPTQYFDSNLRTYYFHLLDDPIFAVRRTASMILPLLAENFGMNWLITSILPSYMIWSKHMKYLYRYVALNGINELLNPSVEKGTACSASAYLDYFKDSNSQQALRALAGIAYMNKKLLNHFATEKMSEIIAKYDAADFVEENVKIYAEDALNVLQKNRNTSVFSLEDDKLKENEYCYIEGLLIACNKFFLPVLVRLSKDAIQNVQIFSRYTTSNVKKFAEKLDNELQSDWVQEKIKLLAPGDLQTTHDQLDIFMKQLSLGPCFKNTYEDDVKPEHLVTPSDESLPDLGAEDLDLEVNDTHEGVNGILPRKFTDLRKNVTEEQPEMMECELESSSKSENEDISLEKDITNIFDSKLASL